MALPTQDITEVIDDILGESTKVLPDIKSAISTLQNTEKTNTENISQNANDISSLQTEVGKKANTSDLTSLQTSVDANTKNITDLQTEVGNKANASDLTALKTEVGNKANSSDLTALQTTVSTNTTNIAKKVDQSSYIGTNLLFGANKYTKNSPLSLTSTKDDYQFANGTIYVYLEEGNTYTVNYETDGTGGENSGEDTVEIFLLKNGGYDYVLSNKGTTPKTLVCKSTGKYILRVDVNKSGVTHKFWNFKVEKGTNATEYVPNLEEINNQAQKVGKVYGFHVDADESNPSSKVTYLLDAVGMTPAAMNYSSGVFNYGSWENAFFMPRPCMLKYDGTVDYYLNPNDYSKKADGTASDITSDSYGGNAMMEWGQGSKIWMKIVPDSDPYGGSVYIASYQVDEDYRAWSFINNQGKMVDHFYTPIYNGYSDGTRLRSLSGKTILRSKTAQQEIDLAKANNTGDDVLWFTENFSDRQLINFLLILMGKSTDTQTVFGAGNNENGSISNITDNGLLPTGTMDSKGMFWGSNDNVSGVKVFGMENWWGNQGRRTAGWINYKGTQKIKLTYTQEDGTNVVGYNTDGSGYISIDSSFSGSGKYISKMNFNSYCMIPQITEGSSSTHYADILFWDDSSIGYSMFGGISVHGMAVGAFLTDLRYSSNIFFWNIGAAVSCKPSA